MEILFIGLGMITYLAFCALLGAAAGWAVGKIFDMIMEEK